MLLAANSECLKLMLTNARCISTASVSLVPDGAQDAHVNHSDDNFLGWALGIYLSQISAPVHRWQHRDTEEDLRWWPLKEENDFETLKSKPRAISKSSWIPPLKLISICWPGLKWRYQLTSWTFALRPSGWQRSHPVSNACPGTVSAGMDGLRDLLAETHPALWGECVQAEN